ncbi:hypothetical protein LSH36_932g01094 [Paralvinella palmiformis]|uniref:Ammonium transporter AmtB-like domain-containing protein n=1 Tax=Paralvinella palmiformis TaxID=53620 RepID=A0AAD9IXQ2_9ANNE|nr:hypothetical protein LSH36_932g01094 [Paralvinella palmiformis]
MTFLKRYGFSSLGFNFLIAAFVLEWATLVAGFLEIDGDKIQVGILTLLQSDFTAAAVLISFGALLGKASLLQLIVMAVLETVIFCVNEWIGVHIFHAVDVGGSMFVHVFGAYFGIVCARMIYNEHSVKAAENKQAGEYHSDLFSMIGTLFLWMFWPSFNSALAPGDDQHRAIINTYYSLAACTVTAFAVSSIVNKHNKFEMEHIQNSTLAGGVAVGTIADMMIHPWGAMLVGMIAGAVSVIGYKYLSPCLAKKFKLHDTCGVNNLHGIPGLIAGVAGIVASAVATEDQYDYRY